MKTSREVIRMSTYESVNFFDPTIWGPILLVGVLFASLLLANIIKTKVPFFKKQLIPNSVLGGLMILIISTICFYTKGSYLFNLPIFSQAGRGNSVLEVLTYHCLGIGFVAMTLRPSGTKVTKKRSGEVISSGALTVSGYLIQGFFGMIITLVAYRIIGIAPGSGILLAFGYGQGTGQALNIGKNFDAYFGGGGTYANMGLSLAALGFLVASIAGVAYFNVLRKKGKIKIADDSFEIKMSEVMGENEVPNSESVDKLSIQICFILIAYSMAYGIMYLLGKVVGGMIGTVYGFNFLFGVLSAVIVKAVINLLKKWGWLKKDYLNVYLLNRISGFAFDLMIVAGICAIQIDLITNYIGVIMILGIVGAVMTFLYVRFVCKRIFPEYSYEQFFAFFGMLTGTASTGMMLLRAADPELKTPASENLVYQNFPAIVMGLPVLILATSITGNAADPTTAFIMTCVCAIYFLLLNVIIFRSKIFKRKAK